MKKIIAVVLALGLALSLLGCGAAKGSESEAAPEAPASRSGDQLTYNSAGLSMTESYDQAAEEAGLDGGSGAEDSVPAEDPDKIIYSADVDIETLDFEDSLEKLEKLLDDHGGWVESSSVSGADYYDISRGTAGGRSASYTLRVPSEKFNQLMNSLTELGNVPYSHIYTENVSAQYYDAQARLSAYSTQEESLIAMMEKAQTVADVIAIEEKLTELRYKIESIQSSLNNWDRQISYSSLYISISEVGDYSPTESQSYGQELKQAFTDGLRGVGEFFKHLSLFLVSALPVIVLAALLLLALIPIIKKRRAKKKALRQARSENIKDKT